MRNLLILTLVVAALILLVISNASRRKPELDDAALRYHRSEVPPQENAYTHFVLVSNTVAQWDYYAERHPAAFTNALAFTHGARGDTNLLAEAVRRGEPAMTNIAAGLACAACLLPATPGYDTPIPEVQAWRGMGRLMALKTQWLFLNGDEEDAFELALDTVRFGHMIENCGGGITHYLVGVAIKALGLARIEAMIPSCSLAPGKLLGYAHALAQYEPNLPGLQNAFKIDYAAMCKHLDDIATGRPEGIERWDFYRLPWFFTRGYVLQTTKTKRMYAALYRMLISDVHRTCLAAQTRQMGAWERPRPMDFVAPNLGGKLIFGITAAGVSTVIDRKCRDAGTVRAVCLMLALKAYHRDHQSLPESLAALVPAYLPAIPDDPFDGSPFRYSAERKMIYSVGGNLIDNGGSDKIQLGPGWKVDNYTRWSRCDDAVFRLNF